MNRDTITRRSFVKGAAAGVAGVSLARATGPAPGVRGANERIRIASIGIGGQGSFHLHQFAKMKDVQVVAVCDVDQSQREKTTKIIGSSPRMVEDFRDVLDMKDVDAVVIATPDHWHAIPAIRACQAGKDVYVEKPIGHNIKEGRAMAEAARKHDRVVLHGTQQRSGPHWINAVKRIKAGELGKISMAHVWNAWNAQEIGGPMGRPPDGDSPPGVDYDMWLGPAPERRFNRLRFHGSWYYFWDYSGGMVSAWAVHLFDVVMWALGPRIKSVATAGGNFVFDDPRETPDTASAVFDCPGYTMTYTIRHGNAWRPHGDMDHGIEFFGTEATLQINRAGFEMYRDQDRSTRKPFYREAFDGCSFQNHKRHFLDCIRTRNKPRCDAHTGHLSSAFGHLANISYRVGRKIEWDSKAETIAGDPEADRLLTRRNREPWCL